MTVELQYLAWVTILTLLTRVPWMLNKVTVRGLDHVSGYPPDSAPLSPWAYRVRIAHDDAVSNLVVFSVLVIVLHLIEESSAWTRLASAVYFWARSIHFVSYAFAVPRIKTAAFLAGFGGQLVLALHLLARAI